MKKGLIKKLAIVGVAVVVIAVVLVIVLKPTEEKQYYDNETDALVFSTLEVDKVFNPFFSTSATDSNVVGMTQIGMLGNDKDGLWTYGDDEAVVTKDLEIRYEKNKYDEIEKTTYYFVLKNNIQFSNGSYLSMKDVLFNLYVYLDIAYSGSSTIYSTDIVGLKEYRTQSSSEKEQEAFRQKYENEANSRIAALIDAKDYLYSENEDYSMGTFLPALEEFAESELASGNEYYKNVVKDYEKAVEFFRKELETDYSNSLNSYEDVSFETEDGRVVKPFTSDVEVFLYNEGCYKWDKKTGTGTWSIEPYKQTDSGKVLLTKEEAIETYYYYKIPDNIDEIVSYWATAQTLFDYLVNEAIEKDFSNAELKYPNISGIKFANKDEAVEVNGVTYAKAEYDENGNVKSDSHEVLSITINKVDPKAIWNFAFTVAPMYYYSNEEQIELFDYETHFGVEYASQTFMNEVVKHPDKIGVPVGAGAYAASKSSGGITDVKASDFYDLGVIYFERNPYFVMGPAKIKKVRFQVVPSNQMLNSLYTNKVDFIEPNAKPETITELNGKKDEGIGNESIRTSGYGYIGVNAGKVPTMAVRQAIMHAINTQLCVDYYQTTASAIYRPMSLTSWAYPKDASGKPTATAYYPFIGGAIPEDLTVVNPAYREFVEEKGKSAGQFFTEEEQKEFIIGLVTGAGYTLNNDGIYNKTIQGNTYVLDYTFTVAGAEKDHPAWSAMVGASTLLNKCGFKIRVTTDANALNKLASGALEVWAAAWGSTIDPDMYQVYHMDSQATSTLNWGYKQIKRYSDGMYKEEYKLIEELSELIDEARETNDKKRRAEIYADALDIVMQLAIELPTYQRDDLYAFNTNKIDITTFTPKGELSPFKGLTSDLHEVSLNEEE